MANDLEVTQKEIEELYTRLRDDAGAGGYYLNPDTDFVKELVQGLIENEKRYGYWACPCRLASGRIKEDTDIICPCDYRDPDLSEFGCCYCSLYVSGEIEKGKKQAEAIPDRRFEETETSSSRQGSDFQNSQKILPYPVWRCKVCGYLCARDEAPENCPICKVTKDRFECFM